MEEQQLKPCPFCGGVARIQAEYNVTKKAWYTQVKCVICYASSLVIKTQDDPNKQPDVFKKVSHVWNQRYIDIESL